MDDLSLSEKPVYSTMRMIFCSFMIIFVVSMAGCDQRSQTSEITTNSTSSTNSTNTTKSTVQSSQKLANGCVAGDRRCYDEWMAKQWKEACKTDKLKASDRLDEPL